MYQLRDQSRGAQVTTRSSSTAQILTGIAAALAMLYFLRAILIPFVIAFVLAVLVRALVRFIRNRWAAAPAWAVVALAGLVVVIAAAGGLFVLVQGMVQIVAEGPKLADRLDQIVSGGRPLSPPARTAAFQRRRRSVSVPQLAGSILSGLQGFAAGLLLMVVYFGFMLAGAATDRAKGRKSLQVRPTGQRRSRVAASASTDIETYVWVQTITGTC